ncbi:unnamed protein product [marine sediment metagenome]|uniref:Peptidase M15C domain-containing protein n=1 Tax=marine sediment metagenome TaxID=412755 RepID=X0T3C2_9ZZZZ
MSLSDEQYRFIQDLTLLFEFCIEHKIKLTGGELYRTKDQQELYFSAGKSKTMNSNHLKKLAIDLNFWIDRKLTYKKSKLQFIGDYWESLSENNRWGGNYKSFRDTPHFERVV